jgi:hypothetical protein
MLLLTALSLIDKKLLAYNFTNDSGLQTTAEKTGINNSSVFSYSLTNGIGVAVYALLSLLGVIFLGLIIYAGVLWMIAEGDEAKVEKARKILVQAITGLIIVLAAYAISLFVLTALAPK